MRKSITEESVLFISILKWFVLASIVGVAVGISTAVFLVSLEWSSARLGQNSYYFFLLPVATREKVSIHLSFKDMISLSQIFSHE